MKIETDTAEIVSGVRHSQTIGSPIAVMIRNADWKNWTEILPVEGGEEEKKSRLRVPVRATRISRAQSSTTIPTPDTSSNEPAPAKPLRGSRSAQSQRVFCANSESGF